MSEPKEINLGRVAAAPPDWNVNDPMAAGYIKNRPFYATGTELETYLPETYLSNFSKSDGFYSYMFTQTEQLSAGMEYTMQVKDTTIHIQAIASMIENIAYYYLGDAYDAAEPVYGFCVYTVPAEPGMCVVMITDLEMFKEEFGITSDEEFAAASVSITYMKEQVCAIPSKFLPFKTVHLSSYADVYSVDFGRFNPGDIVFVVKTVSSAADLLSSD